MMDTNEIVVDKTIKRLVRLTNTTAWQRKAILETDGRNFYRKLKPTRYLKKKTHMKERLPRTTHRFSVIDNYVEYYSYYTKKSRRVQFESNEKAQDFLDKIFI